jgi:hypothetical protein
VDDLISIGKLDEKIFKQNKSQGVLFAFGCADPTIFNYAPQQELDSDSDSENGLKGELGKVESELENEKIQIGLNNPGQDILKIKDFRMICFPKTTNPIKAVSCGAHHALALTIAGEMYYWGRDLVEEKDDYLHPRGSDEIVGLKLVPFEISVGVKEHQYKQKIVQIACGYFHCMCLTEHYLVYSWGMGNNGRLGHGDNTAQIEPKLIEELICEKIIKISAGDKHSACINSRFEAFTWGCHKNGKLGFDSKEEARKPVKLEDLLDYEFIDVA